MKMCKKVFFEKNLPPFLSLIDQFPLGSLYDGNSFFVYSSGDFNTFAIKYEHRFLSPPLFNASNNQLFTHLCSFSVFFFFSFLPLQSVPLSVLKET